MINSDDEYNLAAKKLEIAGDKGIANQKLLKEVLEYQEKHFAISKGSAKSIEKLKEEYRKSGGTL